MQKRQLSPRVKNKLKGALGVTHFEKDKGKLKATKVHINVKAHKGDRKELASTIKHEMLHVKNPNMTEKEVYKRSKKTRIGLTEQERLIRMLKKPFETGSMIAEMNRRNALARNKSEIKKVLI